MLEKNNDWKNIEKLFSYNLPCVIFIGDAKPSEHFIDIAEKNATAILTTPLESAVFSRRVYQMLDEIFAETETIHGVLVEVYGIGILITGESGIGKSEAALELVKRGHRLVSDDVVEIRKVHHPSGSQYWEDLNDWDELQNSDFDFIRCDGANPWDEDAGMRQAKFLRSNPQKAKEIIMNLCKAYYAYVEDYADETVRVLNWDYNLDGVADSYTSYLVEYEVGEGNYALLDLTEFDKDERFEWELLYDGNSLTEMHDYYE